jgi:hypothetical protein
MDMRPNEPAAGKAGIVSRLTIDRHCPGLPEPERWTMTLVAPVLTLGILLASITSSLAATHWGPICFTNETKAYTNGLLVIQAMAAGQEKANSK